MIRFLIMIFVLNVILIFDSNIIFSQSHKEIYLADGFDYPVGGEYTSGYYMARGFIAGSHPGEDWNGRGGGDTDLGDRVYSIGNGVVVLSKNHPTGKWGNTIVMRHAYRKKTGKIVLIDSFYTHLHKRKVSFGQLVKRGQYIGTIGRGPSYARFHAHLHFEIRKDLRIGMKRYRYPVNITSYHIPRSFIRSHRNFKTLELKKVKVPLLTFYTDFKNLNNQSKSIKKNLFASSYVSPFIVKELESIIKPEISKVLTNKHKLLLFEDLDDSFDHSNCIDCDHKHKIK